MSKLLFSISMDDWCLVNFYIISWCTQKMCERDRECVECPKKYRMQSISSVFFNNIPRFIWRCFLFYCSPSAAVVYQSFRTNDSFQINLFYAIREVRSRLHINSILSIWFIQCRMRWIERRPKKRKSIIYWLDFTLSPCFAFDFLFAPVYFAY